MKSIKELVIKYIENIEILEGLESKQIQYSLKELLDWNEKSNQNVIELKKAIINKYNVDFNDGCNSKGQEKLNELCNVYLVI
jgi:hypothetical protein